MPLNWYGGRPRPRRLSVRWGPSSPSPKRRHNPQFSAHVYCGQTAVCSLHHNIHGPKIRAVAKRLDGSTALGWRWASVQATLCWIGTTQLSLPQKGAQPPIFCPCLLRPNGCMHQDTTWYRGRPHPRRHCQIGTQLPLPQGNSPQFSAHVRCGQTAGWTKMPLGMVVGLGPAPPKRGAAPPTGPQFSAHVYCGLTPGWMKTPLGTEVDLGPGHTVLDRDPAPPTRERGTTPPPLSAHVYCGHGRPSQLLLSSCSTAHRSGPIPYNGPPFSPQNCSVS